MADWPRAVSPGDIPAADLERIVLVLEALDAAFRPLADSLRLDDEPAMLFHCEREAVSE